MRRTLLHIFVVSSLLLCVATSALWIRSFWRYDQVWRFDADYAVDVGSGVGVLYVFFGPNYKGPDALPRPVGWRYRSYSPPRGGATGLKEGIRGQLQLARYNRLEPLGLAYDPNQLVTGGVGRQETYYSAYRIYFPHWLVIVLSAIGPTIVSWRRRRIRLRGDRGQCLGCGYDLRATPGQCPECGATAPNAPPSKEPPLVTAGSAADPLDGGGQRPLALG